MAIGHRRLNAGNAHGDEHRAFALDVLSGLGSKPKHLACKWLYDAEGSRLINSIMDLDEYYLTRAETEILETYKSEIVSALGNEPFNLVDLGAGDGRKTGILIDELARRGTPFEFYAIDISADAGRELALRLSKSHPNLEGSALAAEYPVGLAWLAQETRRRKLVLFLGSNIGNLSFDDARAFLRSLWLALEDGDRVLIGFDQKKEIERLVRAYDDAQGVTARFNLNLLGRINRELAGEFDLDRFRFYCAWEPRSSAIESYLVSRVDQRVAIGALRRSFEFEAFEPIHTESSRKYSLADVRQLASETGFALDATFRDRRADFVDALWRVEKSRRASPRAESAAQTR